MKRNHNFIKDNSNLQNSTLKSIKVDNKLLNQTSIENRESLNHLENKFNKNSLNKTNIQYKTKDYNDKDKIKKNLNIIKEKRINKHKGKCLSNENLPPQTHRLKINNNNLPKQNYLNNNYSDNINTIKEKGFINNNNNFPQMNSLSISSVSSKKEILGLSNKMSVFDLSSLFIDGKNFAECSQILISKLKKNGFNINCNKNYKIKCSKNSINFEIDILKMNTNEEEKNDKNENKDIYYYKINNKKNGIVLNKVLSKILLGP